MPRLSPNWLLYLHRNPFIPRRRERLLIPVFLGFSGGLISKESACNVGDPSSIPGSGRSPWRRDRLPTPVFLGFPGGSEDKESTCNVGDLGLIPGLGRSPGEGKGYPLRYSGLENSVECIVHGLAKSWTRLSDFHFSFTFITTQSWRFQD